MNKDKKSYIAIILSVITIILEILPYGAVLVFKRPTSDGTTLTLRETYAYFSLEPIGWFNFLPFLTAISTCILLVLGVLYAFTHIKILKNITLIVCILATFTSILPLLLFGINHYSVVGALISIVLLTECFMWVK